MVLLKLLIFTLTFYDLIVDLDATHCPKGFRVTRGKNGCESCPNGYYQPEENDSLACKPCTTCEKNRGSIAKKECTKVTDTQCQCHRGFVPWGKDPSTCKCDIGFGLKNGDCLKCEHGYFSTQLNSECQKWNECKSGVNITGSSISDVICNKLESNTDINVAHITHLETQAPNMPATTTTSTTVASEYTSVTEKKKDSQIYNSSNTGNHIGVALLVFGVVGLLALTVVTCKVHIRPCVARKQVQTNDSLCRRPVEESGDDSLSSLKQNPV